MGRDLTDLADQGFIQHDPELLQGWGTHNPLKEVKESGWALTGRILFFSWDRNSPDTAWAAASHEDAPAASLLLLPPSSCRFHIIPAQIQPGKTAHAATSPGHSLLQALAPCSCDNSLCSVPLPEAFWTCSYVHRVAPVAGCYTSV